MESLVCLTSRTLALRILAFDRNSPGVIPIDDYQRRIADSHVPEEIYDAIQTHLFRTDSDGTPNTTGCCKVAGLGGNPYRDGSFKYYMSEPIRDNDPKAVGPFIMACIMLGK